jgi:hypothetical protein
MACFLFDVISFEKMFKGEIFLIDLKVGHFLDYHQNLLPFFDYCQWMNNNRYHINPLTSRPILLPQ